MVKTKTKISMTLIIALIMSMVSFAGMDYAEAQTSVTNFEAFKVQVEEAQDGEVIYVQDNMEFTSTVEITTSVSIVGNNKVLKSPAAGGRHFVVSGSGIAVTMSGMTLRGTGTLGSDGNVTGGVTGDPNGGIHFKPKSVVSADFNNMVFELCTHNVAGMLGSGGAVLIDGFEMTNTEFIFRNTVFRNNKSVYGGAIAAYTGDSGSELNLSNCTLNNNYSDREGGAVYAAGLLSMTNCTVYRNHSTTLGGGIRINNEYSNMVNCTITANHSATSGGGIYASVGARENHKIKGSIVAGNTADIGADEIFLRGIIPNTVPGIGGDTDYNIIGWTPSQHYSPMEVFGVNEPSLFTAANGMPVIMLCRNSYAWDGIAYSEYASWYQGTDPIADPDAFGIDQRGMPRPQNSIIDIGAVELQTSDRVTINFVPEGGTIQGTATKYTVIGMPYGELPTATREFHTFNGWYTAPTGGTKISAETIITNSNDHGIYAQWTRHPSITTSIKSAQKNVYLKKGQSITLPLVEYTNDGRKTKLTYKTSKKKIATVTQKGKVKAKKKGKAVITVKAPNGKSLKFNIYVANKATKTKKVNVKYSKTMKAGATKTLKVTISPKKATKAIATFKSSKPSVLSVDKAGKLTANRKGTAKITIKAGGKKKVITVKVKL